MQSCHPSVLPVKCEFWVVLFLIAGIVIDCFDWLWTLDMKTLLIHDSSMNHDDVAGVDECLTPPYSSVNSSTGSPCSTVTDSQGPQSPLFQDDLSPVAIEGLFCLTHRVPTPPGKSWNCVCKISRTWKILEFARQWCGRKCRLRRQNMRVQPQTSIPCSTFGYCMSQW